MKYLLLIPLLFCAIFFESVWIRLPFLLAVLIVLAVFSQKEWVFFVAGISGLLLDSVLFRPLGVSSIFFCSCLLLIFLYQKKFEIQTFPFVVGSTAIASVVYLLLFGFGNLVFQLIGSVVLSLVLYGGVVGWQKYLLHHFKK